MNEIPSHHTHERPFMYNLGLNCCKGILNVSVIFTCHKKYGLYNYYHQNFKIMSSLAVAGARFAYVCQHHRVTDLEKGWGGGPTQTHLLLWDLHLTPHGKTETFLIHTRAAIAQEINKHHILIFLKT